jgi:predicted DsbA family dithiol-disulfide isomerase
MMKKLRVDIWSDIACPWCYIGKRRIEAALAEMEHRDEVQVVYRSFELDPAAPPVAPKSDYAERLAKKYGSTLADARARLDRVMELAAVEGIEIRYDRIQPGNTFDAHRLLHYAEARGQQLVVKERLMRAYFTEGAAIGDREVLVKLAAEVGLDGSEVSTVLAGQAFSKEVRADEDEARAHGISGVPFFVFGGKYGVSGAQPASALLQVLEKSWSEA